MNDLVFLKLGGSLITDKNNPETARLDVIDRITGEIRAALTERPGLRLVLGHGSGSFGHTAGSRHGTREGVRSPADWLGFAEVWQSARTLNQILVERLFAAGIPVVAFPPSATIISRERQAVEVFVSPLQAALNAGLVPLVNGDVIFDRALGGTILSTEEVFLGLAPQLEPTRVLVAGIEAGVWADYPACQRLLPLLTAGMMGSQSLRIQGSAAVDVTGGMAEKVKLLLALVQATPRCEAMIFSGQQAGNIQAALMGDSPGTLIRA
jgi:isopentenyl phosphate kinase